MIKYEYKVMEYDIRTLELELNKLGASGWEIAGHSEATPSIARIIFKRPQVAGTLALLG